MLPTFTAAVKKKIHYIKKKIKAFKLFQNYLMKTILSINEHKSSTLKKNSAPFNKNVFQNGTISSAGRV